MKLASMLLGVLLLVGCNTEASETEKDSSLELAKQFCVKSNSECLSILSFDFDKTYAEGQKDSSSRFKWSTLISRKSKELESLCDEAPDAKVCENYRNTLLYVYMAGMSK